MGGGGTIIISSGVVGFGVGVARRLLAKSNRTKREKMDSFILEILLKSY